MDLYIKAIQAACHQAACASDDEEYAGYQKAGAYSPQIIWNWWVH